MQNEKLAELGGLLNTMWNNAVVNISASEKIRKLGMIEESNPYCVDARKDRIAGEMGDQLGVTDSNEIQIISELAVIVLRIGDRLLHQKQVDGLQIQQDERVLGLGQEYQERIIAATEKLMNNGKVDEIDNWTLEQANRLKKLIL